MENSRLAVVASMEMPPPATDGPIGWLRQNLFNSWLNAGLTVMLVAGIYAAGRALLRWAFLEANWRVVSSNIKVLAWGRYPADQVWRLGIVLGVISILSLLTWLAWKLPERKQARRWVLAGWLLSPLAFSILLRGLTLPTPATIANNLGYYLFRPELLPLLGEEWRALVALWIVGILVSLTWAIYRDRSRRILSGLALIVFLGLLTPLGLQGQEVLPGLKLPLLVPMLLDMGVSWLAGRALGRSLANVASLGRLLTIAWLLAVPALVITLTNFDVGVDQVAPADILPIVEPAIWSGILLTMVLAVVAILASFPIGVLLALGRRSSLPVVKTFCVLFIELVRGVPLITILFMAQVMLPLFFPLELTLDRVTRALAGMSLFTAAYLAEIVRGGLQSVRREQFEAARALGLSEVLVTGLVVLPQALRAVIPPLMGQFVSIFKDTTLVSIVGLLDLFAVSQSVIKQREFLGLVREVYLFAALFYFVLSFSMSSASRRLEKRLGVEERI